jgi:anthranilate phosphoribosyltransferase
VRGGDAQQNAAVMRGTLRGEQQGAIADIVALNAGAALYATGHSETPRDGMRQAADALATGRAAITLEALVAMTRALAPVSV